MAGQSAEGDSIDLYQVFQSSYNKITKNEYSSSGEGEAYPPPHELYPPDSRFFPFDTRLQGKCEKGEERGDEWGEKGEEESRGTSRGSGLTSSRISTAIMSSSLLLPSSALLWLPSSSW